MNKSDPVNPELIDHRLAVIEERVADQDDQMSTLTKLVTQLTIDVKLLTQQLNIFRWFSGVAGTALIIQAIDIVAARILGS